MEHSQRLTVPGQFEYLTQIAGFVTRAARTAGLSEDDVFHVEMAVDEACSNIIEHAYHELSGVIDLVCTTPEPGRLDIMIHDNGAPFDPETIPSPTIGDPAHLDQLNEGGLGLYFMRKLMDEVSFEFKPEYGNTLYMIKRRAA
jgi:anti-sigma regulatory factor (Ser/Thr protein kinase)